MNHDYRRESESFWILKSFVQWGRWKKQKDERDLASHVMSLGNGGWRRTGWCERNLRTNTKWCPLTTLSLSMLYESHIVMCSFNWGAHLQVTKSPALTIIDNQQGHEGNQRRSQVASAAPTLEMLKNNRENIGIKQLIQSS